MNDRLHTKIKCVVLYDTFDHDTRCSLRHISSTTHKTTTQYVCCDTFLPANVRHIFLRHIKLRHEVLVAPHPTHFILVCDVYIIEDVVVFDLLSVNTEEFNIFIEAQSNRPTYEDIYKIILG